MRSRYLRLLVTMFFMLASYPYLQGAVGKFLMAMLGTALLVALIDAAAEKRSRSVTIALALTSMLYVWRPFGREAELGGLVAYSLALGFVFVLVMRFVLKTGPVGQERVLAALCGYLLLGHLFGALHLLVAGAQDGAYSIGVVDLHDARVDFVYYSFVTLTTLGYGDILPLTDAARSLSIVEAALGVMYLGVLVARLIGLGRNPPETSAPP